MTPVPDAEDIGRFRTILGQRLGFHFEDDRLDDLAELLRTRLAASDAERYSLYLDRLSTRHDRGEISTLAETLTVGETYFFRAIDHFHALTELALPARMKVRAGQRQLRILSAGCASGEEAHTIAMLIKERLPELASWQVSILGIDINPAVIKKAQNGRYSAWSLRETPDEMRRAYFTESGQQLVLADSIRRAVTFEQRNLVDPDPGFWVAGSFDVIFCRNVTMYFGLEVMRTVVARLADALAPGGYLFLGHAETLRNLSHQFHLRHTHNGFYYQRRDDETEGPSSLGRVEPPSMGTSGSWTDAIRGASERIATLTAPVPATTASPSHWDLSSAVELVRKERFTEAMQLVRALPPESYADRDTQLLLAALLTNSGHLPEAREVCEHLLTLDELNAGAHYLLALSLEHAGDLDAARDHDQTAAYLDPTFAMPRLHLGLMAKRASNFDIAKRDLTEALSLLTREDASRILLFGGGFTREMLSELCRTELRVCDGSRQP